MEYKITTIGNLCKQVCSGGTPTSSNASYYNGDIPWLNTNEVNFCNIYGTNKTISEEGLRHSAAKYIPTNTVVVAMYGVTAGKCAITKIPLTTNQACCNLIIDETEADYRYVYYYLMMQSSHLNSLANGGAQQNLNSILIKKYKISLPSLPLQRRIASILSAYDNMIEANSRRIRILEQMAENLYKEWFVRFRFPNYQNTPIENGIPKGWKVERLKNITKRLPFNRLYKAADLEPIGNVIVIDQSTNAYLGYHNNEPSHYANIDNPIIIFGDHSCKFQLMIQNFSLGENVVPFISNDSGILDCYYFYFATHKLIETEEYKRHWGRLMAMKILLPSIESQKAFAKIIKPIFSQINTLQLQSANLIRQRDLLLPRLMSGQLTPLTNQ